MAFHLVMEKASLKDLNSEDELLAVLLGLARALKKDC
jgi:hypothetical protein